MNKTALVLFTAGILTAVSIPFLIDIVKDGELGDSSVKDMVSGLEEIDQITRWLHLLLLTSLLPFASFPFLQKKLPPFWMKMLVFLTANAFAFGIMALVQTFPNIGN